MAKKQKSAFEETQELQQHIVEDQVKDVILEDENEDGADGEDKGGETQIEKKVIEEKKEPEKTEEKQEEKLDPTKLTEEISQSVTEKMIERLTGAKEKKADDKDQELVSPWTKEGRNPKNYDEVADWAMTKKGILDARKAEEEAQVTQEQETQQKEVQEKASKEYNAMIDDELDELYSGNKLPRIKDKNDPKDAGLIARRALFQTMLDVNTKREAEGKPKILSVARIFYGYYKPPTTQPAGEDAPVSMGQGAPEEGNEDEYSYEDLKKEQRGWFGRLRR